MYELALNAAMWAIQMPESSELLSAAKRLSEIKPETPFMLASSFLGWFGLLTVLQITSGTPLDTLTNIPTWLGWHSPENWMPQTHAWLITPERATALGLMFFLSMTFGLACTKYGQHKSGFFGLLGFAGLLELRLGEWTLLASAIALTLIMTTGRCSKDSPSEHFRLTMAYLMLAAFHPVLVFVNVFAGVKPDEANVAETDAQVTVESSADGIIIIVPGHKNVEPPHTVTVKKV